jgi:hypothetical protein
MGLDDNDTRGWVMSSVSGIGKFSSCHFSLYLEIDCRISLYPGGKHHLRGPNSTLLLRQQKLRHYHKQYISIVIDESKCRSNGKRAKRA